MKPAPLRLLVTLAALPLLVARAQDTVRLEVASGDRVLGTLRPAAEVERLLVDLPEGAVLRAVARGRGGPLPRLTLQDATGAEQGRGAAKGTRTRLTATVASSAVHVLRVQGDGVGDGDYQVKLRSRPVTAFAQESQAPLLAGATADVVFAAPAGAVLRAVVRATGGGAVVPSDLELVGPGGTVALAATPAGDGKLKVRDVSLTHTGQHTLRFRNAGADGTWKAKVRLGTARDAGRTIDIRDTSLLGTFGGVQAVFGQRATPESAVDVVPTTGALNLARTQVVVPAGAVSQPTVVSIAETEPFFVDDATFAAGQAVRLEPAGTTFDDPVLVTLPFLAQSFDTPTTQLVVVRRDDTTGEIEQLPGPFDVDLATGVVTFPTSRFSSFQTASRSDRPVKGTFLEIDVAPRLDADGGSLSVATSLVHGDFGPRSGNPADRSGTRHTLTWTAAGAAPARVRVDTDTVDETGSFIVASDEAVVLDMQSGPRPYLRGRSSNGLAWAGDEGATPRLAALLRRSVGTPTPGALAGAWHVFVLEANAVVREDGALTVRLVGQTLALDVADDGSAAARGVVRQIAVHDAPDGAWRVLGDREAPRGGSLLPRAETGDAAYGALLSMELGLARFLTDVPLFPALSGDLLVGTAGAEDTATGAVRLVVLVRQSAGTADRALVGRSLVSSAGFRVGGADGAELADAATALRVEARRTAKGSVSGDGVYVRADRDAAATQIPAAFDGTWRLKPTGLLKESQPLRVGALTPRGELYVVADFRGGRIEIGLGLPARDP